MKKTLSFLLAVVMMTALVLTSCGGGSSKVFLATGSETGTYYSFGIALGQVMKDKIGQEFGVQSTGASKANIQLVAAGDVDMAIVQNDVMDYAFNGTNTFAEEGALSGFSAVATLYAEVVQIVAKPGITSVADLKGKTVSVGDAGSGVEFNARQILAAYGIDIESDIEKNNQGFADSADSLKNGTIDAAFVVAGYPTTAVSELASTYDFNILAVDEEHAAALMGEYGFYTYGVIPGGTYGPVTEDVPAVAVMATIIARNDVPEDTIYALVKGIFDNQEEIAVAHAKGAELSVETAVSGIDIPFHPGATKYFTEVGAM